jgi:uncharacterized membrane protein YkvA (DUF1232 family)
MSSMSDALRTVLARDFESPMGTEQMQAAAAIAPGATPADHVRLGLLQMLLPELVAVVERVIVQSSEKPAVRSMAGGLLTYVCNPLDIIGDDNPLGRVDDTVICALGLKRLRAQHGIDLDARALAVCDVAIESFANLSEDLQNSIEDFVAELESSTSAKQRKG